MKMFFFFFSSRRRHTISYGDWSSDVCSSDLDEDGAAEPLPQHDRLLEGRIGPRAPVEPHQQAGEHGYGSTAKNSSSRSGNDRTSPVIGSLPASASSRSFVSSRSATTTYSVPRRRSAT